jgi:hypothetical protein
VVTRPGQATAWFFGDTFVGRVQPSGAADPQSGFSHSSAMTESGACITTHLGWYGTSLFSDPGDGTWYWPAGSVARSDGSTDVILTRVRKTSAAPPLNFEQIGVAVAHVRADMSVESITPVSNARLAGTDGSGDPEVRAYGNAVATDGQYAYLYAFVTGSYFGIPVRLDQYVARVPLTGSLTAPWQYSTCALPLDPGVACPVRTWTNDPEAARPMDIAPDASSAQNDAPIAAFHVTRYGNGYLAVAKAADVPSSDPDDHVVYAWRASSPDGPWSPLGAIGDATPSSAPGAWTYVAQVIPTANAGWVLTWNANADDAAVRANVRLYGPQFATPSDLPPA